MKEEQAKYYFHQGTNFYAYRFLGSHYKKAETVFRLWAPNARAVSVVGEFNEWNKTKHPLKKVNNEGIWEIIIPNILEFTTYQYAILTTKGDWIYKSDPFAYHHEVRPNVASKVYDIDSYEFQDEEWMKKRKKKQVYSKPMNIYELNLGSWRKYKDGSFFNYRKLGEEVSEYVLNMGYTHIEIMPINEYPLDESWGYQVTGYFAITSRYGTPADFKAFVDICHQKGIGVIVDWVPGHFCKDKHGLINFDGQTLYEHPHPLRQEHADWGTRIFDYGRPEIQSFLVSSAMFLLNECHVDGLRVDAVASMLYLDYGRTKWLPNSEGTNINLEAVAFIKKLNSTVHKLAPGVIMIAEESTAYPYVTNPVSEGGLGFDYKWNMGWMNDTLTYVENDPIYRGSLHHKITFQMMYIFSEHFILPLSHDEVVHGKKSLLDKMPGTYEQKFAGYETYLTYLMSHPGHKLTFMGSEFGQFIEWNPKQEIDWLLLEYESHQRLQSFVKEINQLYLKKPALYQNNENWLGFKWVNADDAEHNVFSYYRIDDKDRKILVICNFSFMEWKDYILEVEDGTYKVFLTTTDYNGLNSTLKKKTYQVKNGYLKINLPPISGIYLRKVRKVKDKYV